MQYRDARAQELMQEQAKLNELIRDDVETVIKEIQEELNLDFIYSVDQASNILYANPAFDITDVAVEKLNRNFRAKQGQNAAPKK
jgi:outer membrane protein